MVNWTALLRARGAHYCSIEMGVILSLCAVKVAGDWDGCY